MHVHGTTRINNVQRIEIQVTKQQSSPQTINILDQHTKQNERISDSRRLILEEFEAHAREILQNYENMRISVNHKLRYSVDLNSNEVMVEIVDLRTNEVIKELPSKDLRRFKNQFHDTIGLLFDSQV